MTRVIPSLVVANLIAFLLEASVPRVTNTLVWVPAMFLERPWTLLTYMFLHDGLAHLALNMLGLYVIGSTVEKHMGRGPFTTLYFLSGISGALCAMASSGRVAVVGASAAVFGLMAPFAHSRPPSNVISAFPLLARSLVILIAASSIWSSTNVLGGNAALLTHIGGFLGGCLYHMWWERGRVENRVTN